MLPSKKVSLSTNCADDFGYWSEIKQCGHLKLFYNDSKSRDVSRFAALNMKTAQRSWITSEDTH